MVIERRQFLAAAAAALAQPAIAQQAWPARPLRIVVPFGPGGIADLTARAVGQALGERLGQSVVIENKPGAGGVSAGELVARAEPDGHTLLLMSNGTAVSAGLFARLPFDPQKDFAPISLLGLFDIAILVPEGSRQKTLQDLLAAAKANPGKLNIATVNVGSTQNLAAELFKSAAQVQVQVVPFNGTPAVITALRAGEVDAAVEILGPVKAQVDAKALRVLAVMGGRRPAGQSQVATVAEAGGTLAGFDVSSWNAVAAPAKTPRDVVLRLNRELQAVLASPAVRQRLAALDVEARASSPEQLAALLGDEIRRWSAVIAKAGIPRQ
ncbi:MAG: tripartite tricarboxylate transporter substrate binding protein [Burkholderiales bacterium]|nr:tripartite tricarboxylate transporter substrate binding protein [Burkholderiales bacterium]